VTLALAIGVAVLVVLGAALAARGGALPALPGRALGGVALMAGAVGLALARQFALALPLGVVALGMIRAGLAAARATPRPGQSSEVRTSALAMRLDHDSGEMDGEVLSGRFAGAALSALSGEDLGLLVEELRDDADSLGLLLAYLDRRRDADPDAARRARGDGEGARPGGTDRTGDMSPAEALRILGLAPGASLEEIRAAHHRLMKRVHPDLGGSDALAAMINAAKARLDP